jgi:protein TonB
MMNVLLESSAPRQRRMGSTVASALLHGALIAGAVALTMPGPVDANGVTPAPPPIFVSPTPQAHQPLTPVGDGPIVPSRAPEFRRILTPDFVPVELPPIEPGPEVPTDQLLIGGRGLNTTSPIGDGGRALGSYDGSAFDERAVDRAPRLLGNVQEPRYPATLRAAGVQGRVVVQFVVDTLGHAELGELQVLETAHPLFVDAVREALARYRFSVGEAAGRKVRTRVQLPFEFILAR